MENETFIERVKKSDFAGLGMIADELRRRIIDVVSRRGGHLAPSLGVVELSLALHHVFESPKDSIIWDVGHQSYAHKIITGRVEAFDTLRTKGGLSGFPKRSESVHDQFGAGHSSTSISAAIGVAEAKRMSGEGGKTIAVIGDGSMTAGLAFEGLNHAGHLQNKNLIVILNDNQMSIDRNVGALAKFMNKGITSATYNRVRRDMKLLLSLLSTKDINLVDMSRRAALVVKDFFLAGSLFEAFGFRYFGPVDGHDPEALVAILRKVSHIVDNEVERSNPILLHVITQKGKGYTPAEKDPSRFHGIGPFNIEDGSVSNTPGAPTYTAVFGDAVCDLMETDARVLAITAAMPSGTGLDKAQNRFPGRYYDVGIAEPHAVVFAAGMASRGFRPIVAIYSSFLQRAYDQVLHDVCLQQLPVTFALDRAGVVGEDGPTHHGVFDIAYLRHIPGLVIMSPKDESELRAMLHSAVSYNRPVVIRYPRGRGVGIAVNDIPPAVQCGCAEVLADPEDAPYTVFALGKMVSVARSAASLLEAQGIRAAVINARFVKPLDEACISEQVDRGRRLVTIEDGALAGGFGSAVLEFLNNYSKTSIPVLRIGYPDVFIEHGTVKELHRQHGLDAESIAARIRDDFLRTGEIGNHFKSDPQECDNLIPLPCGK